MTCFYPLRAFRSGGGGVSFRRSEGFADRPLDLPCGQCMGCRIDKSRTWALRCMHEASLHTRSCFITLTYSPQSLPENGSLEVRDVQLFLKRLRKNLGALTPIRYFLAGEYGPENLRPHYHALLFGEDFAKDRVKLQAAGKHALYTSQFLSHAWGKGFATIGECTYQSAAYVARYILKKVNGDRAELRYGRTDPETGEHWEVAPEFLTMSRRPGIGRGWFDKYRSDVYPSDFIIHDGKKHRPPKYYDNQLPEGELEVLKSKRRAAVKLRAADLSGSRLEAKALIAASRCKERRDF